MTTPAGRIGPVGVDVSESTGSIEDYLDTAPELEQIVVDPMKRAGTEIVRSYEGHATPRDRPCQ